MSTSNDHRKDPDQPRYYDAPAIHQQYVLITNQMHGAQPAHLNYHQAMSYQHAHQYQTSLPLQPYDQYFPQVSPYGLMQMLHLSGQMLNPMIMGQPAILALQQGPQQGIQQGLQQGLQQGQHGLQPGLQPVYGQQALQAGHSQTQPHVFGANHPNPSQTHSSQGQGLQTHSSQSQGLQTHSSQNQGLKTHPGHTLPSHTHLIERLQEVLPVPPLEHAPTRPDVAVANSHRRTKRKLKFSKRQDDLIVQLKKEGRPWVEIAEVVGVGSYLAARNRYQVIVGQQGNNNSLSWTSEDRDELHRLLDSAELDKWQYIAHELLKATGKDYSPEECREHARAMFWQSPVAFGVLDDTVVELLKEKRVTERLVHQVAKDDYEYLKRYNHSPQLSI